MNTKKSRTTAAAAFASALALGLAGCASGGGDGSAESSGEETPIRIGIDIPFHPLYSYMANQSDELFADSSCTFDFQVLDATTMVPAWGAGDLDVMTTTSSFMPRVQAQYGIDPVYVFPMARFTEVSGPILVPADSPIETIEDLRGRTVAIPPLDSRFGIEEAIVQGTTGESIREYFDLVESNAAVQEAYAGRADAAYVEAPANQELLEAGWRSVWNLQSGTVELFDQEYMLSGGFITSQDFLDASPECIEDLVAGTQATWNLYQEDPAAVNDIAATETGLPLAQLEAVAGILNLAGMPEEERRVNEKDVEVWTQMFGLLYESGFLTEEPDDVESLYLVTED